VKERLINTGQILVIASKPWPKKTPSCSDKLDENLSPSLAALFATAGHEAHSVVQQSLGGQSDAGVIDVCRQEHRAPSRTIYRARRAALTLCLLTEPVGVDLAAVVTLHCGACRVSSYHQRVILNRDGDAVLAAPIAGRKLGHLLQGAILRLIDVGCAGS